MKIKGYHEGDRSEPYGQIAFSTIGHCVPVPRQADYFGVDLYVQMFKDEGRALCSTGSGCAVQIKSNTDDIAIDSDEKRLTLHGMAYPFFVAIIDKSHGTISVYSTLLRSALYWLSPNSDYLIKMGGDYTLPTSDNPSTAKILSCGKPIVHLRIADLDAPETKVASRKMFREIMDYWIALEADVLAWKANHIPMIPLVNYQTNHLPTSIPNLLTVGRQEHIHGMIASLDSSLFAAYSCSAMVSQNLDYELTPVQRQALSQLSDESLAMAHRMASMSDCLPFRGQEPVRMMYRFD